MSAGTVIRRVALPVLLLAMAGPARAADRVTATSEIAPRVVGVGERVRFSIAVEGPGFVMPRLRPRFDTGSLEIVAGPSVSHGLTLSGGGGWRYAWSWWLEAKTPGAAAVTDVYLLVGDERIDLPIQRIEIVAQPVGGSEPPRSHREAIGELFDRTRDRLFSGESPKAPDAAFLRAVATPDRPYVGQRVVYTVYLYTRVPVRSVAAEELPSFQGLWARPVDLPSGSHEVVDWEGEPYRRTPILRKELYALAPRRQRIASVRARLVVETLDRDRSFFFPTRTPTTLETVSNPIELEVRPLPSAGTAGPGSAGFDGAVGAVAVAADLHPRRVRVGESARVTVTVAGEAHLESLPAPRLHAGDGIEVLGPEAVPSGGDQLSGSSGRERSWQYLLIPRREGAWTLPPIEVPYFDPEDARYRFATADLPHFVAVAPREPRAASGAGESVGRSSTPGGADAMGPDGSWIESWTRRWRGVLPWALAVPALALAVALWARHRSARPGAAGPGPRFVAALDEDRPRRAAAIVEAAWRERLARAYGMPPSVPPARWADEALARGVDRDVCRRLRSLSDDLHYLRFAPELSETRSLVRDLVTRSRRLASELGMGG